MPLTPNNTAQTHDIGPWYKQPWLWFILAPLIAVFFYGTSYAYLSVVTFDGMVKGDYAKTAKHFNLDLSKLDKAAAMGLSAEIVLDELTGDLRLVVTSTPALNSQTLLLDVVHPTMASLDQPIMMARRPDGSYYGSLNKTINGKRYLHLTGPDNTWRVSQEVNTPWPTNITITAK
jgi:hypothetical protein